MTHAEEEWGFKNVSAFFFFFLPTSSPHLFPLQWMLMSQGPQWATWCCQCIVWLPCPIGSGGYCGTETVQRADESSRPRQTQIVLHSHLQTGSLSQRVTPFCICKTFVSSRLESRTIQSGILSKHGLFFFFFFTTISIYFCLFVMMGDNGGDETSDFFCVFLSWEVHFLSSLFLSFHFFQHVGACFKLHLATNYNYIPYFQG